MFCGQFVGRAGVFYKQKQYGGGKRQKRRPLWFLGLLWFLALLLLVSRGWGFCVVSCRNYDAMRASFQESASRSEKKCFDPCTGFALNTSWTFP